MPYFHDLNPIVIPISGDFAVRWYGLSYTAGFVFAMLVWMMLAKRGLSLVPRHRVLDAMLILIVATLVGGRLGYALVYDPTLLTGFRASFPFWDMLLITKGGMASHGAMVGLAFAAWLISRGWREPPSLERTGRSPMLHVMDMLALLAPVGLLLGRFANFVNGELLGKIVALPGQPGPWWSVRFPQELLGWNWIKTDDGPRLMREASSHAPDLSPQQIEALDRLVMSVKAASETWHDGLKYVVTHASRYREQLEPLLSARHPSQVYQALAEGLVLGAVVWLIWMTPRKPGVIAAWWLMVYGVLRVITEFWRLPDAQFAEGRPLGLSRGQWLSVGMVAIGAVLLAYAIRRAGPRLGGWWRRAPITPTQPATGDR